MVKRRMVVALSVAALASLSACRQDTPKTAFERDYETMVARCKAVAVKGDESRCENGRSETGHRKALATLHGVMIEQIMKLLPPSGSCSIHGASYLICQHTVGGTRSTIYRLDVAPDGSGNQVMSVWSRQPWSR